MNLEKVAAIIGEFFDRERTACAVVGALAMQAYGSSRATQDLDLAAPAAIQPSVLRFMTSLGYESLHVSAGYSNHLHGERDMGRVDFVYLDTATSHLFFSQTQASLKLGDRTFVVPSAEHLIAMKVHAIKNDPTRLFRDMADLQVLMSLPGLDDARVRHYFERSGLMARYDEIKRTL